ncbi:MAG: hypothetical protein NUV46_01510 [Nanoarchaeota archaeon]|nr:hypothetical protein [Nanoarchaeota archaeon]
MKKKGQINIIDLFAGIVVIAGGALIASSYTGVGVIFTSIGLLIEAIKYVVMNGPK